MEFDTFNNFYKKRKNIKRVYKQLSWTEKIVYKKYIYARPFREYFKDCIWNYLNLEKDEVDYISSEKLKQLCELYFRKGEKS